MLRAGCNPKKTPCKGLANRVIAWRAPAELQDGHERTTAPRRPAHAATREGSRGIGPDKPGISSVVTADCSTSIKCAGYWQPGADSDSIRDSPKEGVALTLDNLAPGAIKLAPRVTDKHACHGRTMVLAGMEPAALR